MTRSILSLTICLLGLALVASPTNLQAQQPIRGNGRIIEQTRPLELFSTLRLDFPANVVVTCGSMPGITIRTDANCMPHVVTRQRGKVLEVLQGRWIEPSTRVEVSIGTAFLSNLESSGYGSIRVEGLETPTLSLRTDIGDVTLVGRVDQLRIQTTSAIIDASACQAGNVTLQASEDAMVRLRTDGSLTVKLSDPEARVYVDGDPVERRIEAPGEQVLAASAFRPNTDEPAINVAFTLTNDSNVKRDFYVKGPRSRRFSYGFPMQPQSERPETWPVGTKVYEEGPQGARKLLLTVDTSISGQTVSLSESMSR
jgi:hypothetical protein